MKEASVTAMPHFAALCPCATWDARKRWWNRTLPLQLVHGYNPERTHALRGRGSTEREQPMLAAIFAQAEPASAEQLTRDSAILGEQFYFFTVVLMWLIHAGFMSYEAGVARRKNVMATAMKNILTIAVVTPTFYYFGWLIYNCAQPGIPIGPNSSDFTSIACQGGIPWSDAFGPNLTNNINLIFFLAFLLFSWTTASIMSGAIIERARLSA